MKKPAGPPFPDPAFMRRAIKEARRNLQTLAGGPFGACIVKDGTLIAAARNTVLRNDATCHAEVNAIRKASRKLGTFDLSGCVIYTTTEACPMCFSAIHWARIGTIVSATRIEDAKRAGFHELEISNARLKALGRSRIRLIAGFLRDEALELFTAWARLAGRRGY